MDKANNKNFFSMRYYFKYSLYFGALKLVGHPAYFCEISFFFRMKQGETTIMITCNTECS